MHHRLAPALVVVTLAACVPNIFYTPPAGDTSTGDLSSTSAAASTSGAASTSADASSDPATTAPETTTDSPACQPGDEPLTFPITDDTYFIKTELEGPCVVSGIELDPMYQCAEKTFDWLDWMDLRFGPEYTAMYALQVDVDAIFEALAQSNQAFVNARIVVRIHDVVQEPVKLVVGAFKDPWDIKWTSYNIRDDGNNGFAWPGEGPISDTTVVCATEVPAGSYSHEHWSICPANTTLIGDRILQWRDQPETNHGLLLYIDEGGGWGADGPIVKAWESMGYEAYVLVDYCTMG
ncbi:MAG: hypothetical protein H6711_16760 [Myxococcales bacterium]|nr:hypothetical protein [Myxococcales bacterium]